MASNARSLLLACSWVAICGCSSDDPSPDLGVDAAGLGDAAGACQRRVLVSEVTNARELGGHPLDNGARVLCGKLLRGGDLTRLTPSGGCAELATLGVRTVIDLRQSSVQQSAPPPACATAQAKVVAAPLPKLLPDTVANYLALLEEKQAVAAVFAALGDPQGYPAYIHCVIGRDRASFITALIMLALDAQRQSVVDEFELSTAAGIPVQTPCIEAVLDEIAKRGGIKTYLTGCGVTSAQLDTLRKQAAGM